MSLRWIARRTTLGVAALFFSACALATLSKPPEEFLQWSQAKTPSTGETRIFGTYQAGCLAGAAELPLKGKNFEVVRTWKRRFFGHPALINYLTNLGLQLDAQKQKTMLIEDLGYPRGGPFFNGHNSHQVGLDVDISLMLVSKSLSQKESDSWESPSYVTDRKFLKPNWKQDQIVLTQMAASFSEVNRIFVAPAIKKYFCDTTPSAPWLYKLRAWWGHDDHLHVRLTCPAGENYCKDQTPLNSNDNGCGEELAWWFSAEADKEWEEMQNEPSSPRPYPNMPSQCLSLPKEP